MNIGTYELKSIDFPVEAYSIKNVIEETTNKIISIGIIIDIIMRQIMNQTGNNSDQSIITSVIDIIMGSFFIDFYTRNNIRNKILSEISCKLESIVSSFVKFIKDMFFNNGFEYMHSTENQMLFRRCILNISPY